MKKILVPTDFSPNALKALTYAAEIAEMSGAHIYLLHVIEPKINMATMQTDSLNKISIERKSEELNSLVSTALSIYPKIKITPYLLGESVVPALLAYAEKEEMDLIIMGTNGSGGIKEAIMGTVTAAAIEKTNIPILSVPIYYDLKKPASLLLAIDQFEKEEDLYEELMEIAELFSATLNIVLIKDSEEKRNLDNLEQNLKEFMEFLLQKFPNVSITTELLKGTNFEDSIAEYCSIHDVDLLAMVSYPKSFWEKLFRKGNTRSMAFHSTVPILAIPKRTPTI